ncbi:MAG: GNAT family N-acetyltransferase [Solobacterium sp.]|nr:GNAT family N-acetyltransferase [Solobacterium sp.]
MRVVNIDDIAEAFEDARQEPYYYYSPYDRAVVTPGAKRDDSYGYDDDQEEYDLAELIALPVRDEIDTYEIMTAFAEAQEDDEDRKWLNNSLHGKGVYRRFRATLERLGLEDQWYDFEEGWYRVKAIEWCEARGIEYEDLDPRTVYTHIPKKKEPVRQAKPEYRIVRVGDGNFRNLTFMHADFSGMEAEDAEQDLENSLHNSVIYAVSDKGRFLGYLIASKGELRALYVKPEMRRRGLATMLYRHAEKEFGGFAAVSPRDTLMISFYRKLGYDVLDTIILRKPAPGEEDFRTFMISSHPLKG